MNRPATVIVWTVLLLAAIYGSHKWRAANSLATRRAGAIAAVERIADWTKWMAGIQTAALALLALLVFAKDYEYGRRMAPWQEFFAVGSFVFLGASLLVGAWVLSSLPSVALRVHAVDGDETTARKEFDVYEYPIYGWVSSQGPWQLGYFLALKHTLWVAGLATVAALAVSVFLLSKQGGPAAAPSQGSASQPSSTASQTDGAGSMPTVGTSGASRPGR